MCRNPGECHVRIPNFSQNSFPSDYYFVVTISSKLHAVYLFFLNTKKEEQYKEIIPSNWQLNDRNFLCILFDDKFIYTENEKQNNSKKKYKLNFSSASLCLLALWLYCVHTLKLDETEAHKHKEISKNNIEHCSNNCIRYTFFDVVIDEWIKSFHCVDINWYNNRLKISDFFFYFFFDSGEF